MLSSNPSTGAERKTPGLLRAGRSFQVSLVFWEIQGSSASCRDSREDMHRFSNMLEDAGTHGRTP